MNGTITEDSFPFDMCHCLFRLLGGLLRMIRVRTVLRVRGVSVDTSVWSSYPFHYLEIEKGSMFVDCF